MAVPFFYPSAVCPLTGAPNEELHRATEKIQMLKSVYGVWVSVMRDHERNDMNTSHPKVREFLRRHNFPKLLFPQQAFLSK